MQGAGAVQGFSHVALWTPGWTAPGCVVGEVTGGTLVHASGGNVVAVLLATACLHALQGEGISVGALNGAGAPGHAALCGIFCKVGDACNNGTGGDACPDGGDGGMCEVVEVGGAGAEGDAGPGGVVGVHGDGVEGRVDADGAVGHAAAEGVVGEDVGLVGAGLHAAVGLVVAVVGRGRGTDRDAHPRRVVGEVAVVAGGHAAHD